MFNRWQGIAFALVAALLFGASTPLAKSLLPQITPMLMAGLLYLGSGIGLVVSALLCSFSKGLGPHEATLARKDVPWLAAANAARGIVGPYLLLCGQSDTAGSS